jgi:hypothetical protein
MSRRASLPVLAAVVGMLGCGDNRSAPRDAGTDRFATDAAPYVARAIRFVSDGGGAGRIWLEQLESRPRENRVTLRVVGEGLAAYGVAGRLAFDRRICALDGGGAVAGPGLEGNGATILAAAAGTAQGGVFGFTRSGDYRHAATLAAERPIGSLTLVVQGPGHTRIDFVSAGSKALDENLLDAPVGKWVGGTLIVE